MPKQKQEHYFKRWSSIFGQHVEKIATPDDPAHDYLHFQRVVRSAVTICNAEKGRLDVVFPAAWLHDLVVVPKNDPNRKIASKLSAEAAIQFLKSIKYPPDTLDAIAHAIAAHSFSANLPCESLEAQIVQDADRLDGLGAMGIARCFATAGLLKRPFYSEHDPFCQSRPADDQKFTVDHFFKKLFKTAETMNTPSGKKEAQRRVEFMHEYLSRLSLEIDPNLPAPITG